MNRKHQKKSSALKHITIAVTMWLLICTFGSIATAADIMWSGTFSGLDGIERLTTLSVVNDHAAANGSVTISGQTATIVATGYSKAESDGCGGTNTVKNSSKTTWTLKNSHSTKATITYTATNVTPASGTITLESNATQAFVVTSGEGDNQSVTGTVTITAVSYEELPVSTTFQNGANGSYTITDSLGNNLSIGTYEKPSTVSYTLTASGNTGYTFAGWVNGETGELISESNPHTISGGMTVKPVFAAQTLPFFLVGENTYLDLNDANTAAQEQDSIIILKRSGTIPAGTYTIDQDVTLLIPYADGTAAFTDPLTAPERMVETSATPSLFRKLTAANGVTINCSGNIRVDSRQSSLSTQYAGRVYGAYGQIQLDSGSTLNLLTGATLRAYGYVTGDGTVDAAYGSTLYELFQMSDWRGGNRISNIYKNLEDDSFPVSQFYVQNVEASLTVHSGATLTAHASVAAGLLSKSEYSSELNIVGSDGLFLLDSGSSLVRTYTSSGRIEYTIQGNATIGSILLNIDTGMPTVGEITMNSADYVLNLPSNMTIKIDSGTTTLPVRVKLLPSTRLEVNSNATLTLSNGAELVLYDYADWTSGKYTYTGTFFPVQSSASNNRMTSLSANVGSQLVVDGSLIVENASAIYVTSHADSSNSALSGSGQISLGTAPATLRTTIVEDNNNAGLTNVNVTLLQAPLAGVSTSATDYTKSMSFSTSSTNALTYHSKDGTYWYNYTISVQDGAEGLVPNKDYFASKTYSSDDPVVAYISSGGTFAFDVSDDICTVSRTPEGASLTNSEKSYTLSNVSADTTLVLSGHNYTASTTAPTCTEQGYTAYTCGACNHSYVDETSYKQATGHSFTIYKLVDGVYTATCDNNCGETNTLAADYETPVQYAAIQLSAEAEVVLRLKLTIDADWLAENSGGYIILSEEENTESIKDGDNQTEKILLNNIDQYSDGSRYVFECGIAAGEMTGDFTIEVFDGNGDPVYIRDTKCITTKLTRTVLDYAKLALASGNSKLVDLVTAMVTYGGYAQLKYNVDTENLAYKVLEEFNITMPDVDDVSAATLEDYAISYGYVTKSTTESTSESAAALSMMLETESTESAPQETEAEETTETTESKTSPSETTAQNTDEGETIPVETAAEEPTDSEATTTETILTTETIISETADSALFVSETEPAETMEAETVPPETAAAETEPAETEAVVEKTASEEPAETEAPTAEATAATVEVVTEDVIASEAAMTQSAADEGVVAVTAEDFGLEYNAQSLTLNSRISMKTYFTLSDDVDISNYTFVYTYVVGKNQTEYTDSLTVTPENDGRYSVTIEDIPVAYWDYMYTITVTKDGDTAGSYVVKSSVLGWAKRCIEAYEAGSAVEDAAQVKMAQAMYYYNDKANIYFDR